MRSSYVIFGITAALWSSPALAGNDVSMCMGIMSEAMSARNESFLMDDRSTKSREEICKSFQESKGGGIGFGFKFISLDANQSEQKAERICSSHFSSEDSSTLQQLFHQEISTNQLEGFKACLDALTKATDIEILAYNFQTVLGQQGPGAVETGTNVTHTVLSITFKWVPNVVSAKRTTVKLSKTNEGQIITCKMDPTVKPAGTALNDETFYINVLEKYTYKCDAVRRVLPTGITFTFKDASPIVLWFPALPPPQN